MNSLSSQFIRMKDMVGFDNKAAQNKAAYVKVYCTRYCSLICATLSKMAV